LELKFKFCVYNFELPFLHSVKQSEALKLLGDTFAPAISMMPLSADLNIWGERAALHSSYPTNKGDITS
jgi:hypothetical protein